MLKIKKIRKEYNLTQSQLADLVGVTRSAIAQIEGGKNKLSNDLAQKIAEKLNVDLHDIIEDDQRAEIKRRISGADLFNSYYQEEINIKAKISEFNNLKNTISYISIDYSESLKSYNFKHESVIAYSQIDDLIEEYHKNPSYITNKKFLNEFNDMLDFCINYFRVDVCNALMHHYKVTQ